MNLSSCRIAVVGVTGVVGREILGILRSRDVPAANILALASPRSAGTVIPYGDARLTVRAALAGEFAGVDVALFAASSSVARDLVPHAVEAGALVVDNSSAFRLAAHVPLVVPEINPQAVRAGVGIRRVIANPNCSTIIMLVAIEPLRRHFGVRAIQVSTYQAVSGAGQAGLSALDDEIKAGAGSAGTKATESPFTEPCFLNVFSHNSAVDPETGINSEERKMIEETRKILNLTAMAVTPTCVRVPVFRAHSQAMVVKLEHPASEVEVRRAYEGAAGVRVIDDRVGNRFPTPLKAAGGDDVLVGRLRPDPAVPLIDGRSDSWCLFACGDQLRKGAALNAIQIAELASLRGGPPR